MTTMTRHWGWVLALLAVLALTGCFKVDQTLTLNADGSGTLAMRYGMAEQTIAQLQAMQRMTAQGGDDGGVKVQEEAPLDFDPEQVRADFEADKPDGVELTSVTSEVVDGWQYIDLTISFDDIRALKRTELFKNSKLAIVHREDGNYLITQRGGDSDLAGGDAPNAQVMQQMMPMMAGFHIAQTIVVPGDIISTNAPQVDGRRASWVFDIAQDPNVIQTMAGANLELVFDGNGVQLPGVVP